MKSMYMSKVENDLAISKIRNGVIVLRPGGWRRSKHPCASHQGVNRFITKARRRDREGL